MHRRSFGWLGPVAVGAMVFACGSSDREFASGQGAAAGVGTDDGGESIGGTKSVPPGGAESGGTNGVAGSGDQAEGGGEAPTSGGGSGGTAMEPLCSAAAAAARLLSPLSSSVVTSSKPTVRWQAGDDCGPLTVEFCSDRACSDVVESVQVAKDAGSARPTKALPRGVVFWRVKGSGVVSNVWQFNAGVGTPVDTSYGTLPDFDGDGFGDVAVTSANGDPSGSVNVHYGSAEGLTEDATELSLSSLAGYLFGSQMASAGDVNGDGFTDLVVGAPTAPSGGAGSKLLVYLGSENGIVPEAFATLDAGDLKDGGDVTYAGVGSVVRGGIDINQDGYGDFLVTTPSDGNVSSWITPYFGSASEVTAGAFVYGPGSTSGFGQGLAVCDLDGDGVTEMVVGAPDAKKGSNPAPVLIYTAAGAGFTLTQQLNAEEGFGRAVACGDYAHDGYPDIVASWPSSGVRGYEDGDVKLFANKAGTVASSGVSLPLQASSSYINSGRVMATVGDMNGDGVNELAVGQYSSGGVRIFFAPGSSMVGDVFPLSGSTDTSAYTFTSADVNGDGLMDFVSSFGSGQGTEVVTFLGSKTSRIVTPSKLRFPGIGLTFAASL